MARPTKSPDGTASMVLQMRVTPKLHADLRKEAESKGRSLAEQAVWRMQYRECHLTRLVGALVEDAENRMRDRGETDKEVIAAECRRVAHVAVDFALGYVEGPSGEEIDRLRAARLPNETYKQAEDDAWAPYLLAEYKKNGSKVPV